MKITNKYGIPDPIVSAVTRDTYSMTGRISVTGLIRSPRIRALESRHDGEITVDASERIWMLLGSSVHAILERADTTNHLSEERLSAEVLGWKVSGQADLFSSDGTLSDYKVVSVFSYLLGEKSEWVEQLNAYAWLYRKSGFEPKKLQIVSILRDWVSSRAFDEDYPNAPIVITPIPLWDDEKAEEWIKGRVKIHQEAESLPDDKLPHCTDNERWARPDSWAVIKEGNKKAYRVFDANSKASEMLATLDEKKGYKVEHRKGEFVRCERFCNARPFCSQAKQ